MTTIDTIIFDMGGTLEDIYSDEESKNASATEVIRILKSHGINITDDLPTTRKKLHAGWIRYESYRKSINRELKPEEIWGQFVLSEFGLDEAKISPFAEELAHMWEITFFHRKLRPRVKEMLGGLKNMGFKLGIISNTASLFQVFETLNDYGIRDFFSDVTLSSITGYRKPHVNIFNVSLYQLKSDRHKCAYVGDTFSRDVIGAKNAGFGVIFHINSRLSKEKDADVPKDIKATYEITDIYDVYTIMSKLASMEKM